MLNDETKWDLNAHKTRTVFFSPSYLSEEMLLDFILNNKFNPKKIEQKVNYLTARRLFTSFNYSYFSIFFASFLARIHLNVFNLLDLCYITFNFTRRIDECRFSIEIFPFSLIFMDCLHLLLMSWAWCDVGIALKYVPFIHKCCFCVNVLLRSEHKMATMEHEANTISAEIKQTHLYTH